MGRKQDRTHAMKLVFRLGFAVGKPGEPADEAARYISDFAGAEYDDAPVSAPDDTAKTDKNVKIDSDYLSKTYAGVIGNLAEIDRIIDESAAGWKTERISKTDLAILRLAIYEMLFGGEVPAGVAVNEAVELAKIYGADESPAFINGVLGNVAREIEKKEG